MRAKSARLQPRSLQRVARKVGGQYGGRRLDHRARSASQPDVRGVEQRPAVGVDAAECRAIERHVAGALGAGLIARSSAKSQLSLASTSARGVPVRAAASSGKQPAAPGSRLGRARRRCWPAVASALGTCRPGPSRRRAARCAWLARSSRPDRQLPTSTAAQHNGPVNPRIVPPNRDCSYPISPGLGSGDKMPEPRGES